MDHNSLYSYWMLSGPQEQTVITKRLTKVLLCLLHLLASSHGFDRFISFKGFIFDILKAFGFLKDALRFRQESVRNGSGMK